MNGGRSVFIAVLALYGLSLLIFFMDFTYVFKVGIVSTVGRVSIIGYNIYLFTGSLLYDQIIFWALMMTSSTLLSLFMRSSIYVFSPLTLSFIGLVIAFMRYDSWILLSLALASIAAVFIMIVKGGFIGGFIHSLLLVIAVLELFKIAYLLIKLLTGVYLSWFSVPVYVNIVIWYYLWPLVPTALIIVAVCGAFKTLLNLAGVQVPFFFKVRSVYTYLENLIRRPRAIGKVVNHGNPLTYLVVGLLLSIAMGVIPYIPTLNPEQRSVNTDWIYYYSWLNSMVGNDFSVLITCSDRPLYLILLYVTWYILKVDPKAIAIYHNIALFPLHTLSLYLLARRLFGDEVAKYTALLTPFSPILLSFIYGGFQADLLAISLIYISLYLLMGSGRNVFYGLSLFSTIMFVHEWTWMQYMFILTSYILLRLAGRALNRWKLDWRDKAILYYLPVGYVIDILKNVFLNLFSAITVVERATFIGFMPYLDSTHFYTTIFTGGTLNNPLFYVVAMFGLSALSMNLPSLAVVLSILPTLIPWGNITYRLLLNTPLTLLVANGIVRQELQLRIYLMMSFAGIALWRLYTIIPGLPLTG